MTKMFTCKNCRQEKTANPRLKGDQEYCGDDACQLARKAAWKKKRMADDPSYKAKKMAGVNRWRKNRPLHEYQKKYRKTHPEYAETNRQKQKIRNARRSERQKSVSPEKIVKVDALFNQATVYRMKSYNVDASGMIVKVDTLFVELTPLQAIREKFPERIPDCKSRPY